jgi:isopentenyl-diphosphate Delta-isomerase
MKVILVDENDRDVGEKDKVLAHKDGSLHRAFSVFIFNSKKELLIHKRAKYKYHTPGLWSNTCCGHPVRGFEIQKEAEKRLEEEMGIRCRLEKQFDFLYKASLANELIENEYDHIFFGTYEKDPKPNSEEVDDWKWISLDALKADMEINPAKYTPWLRVLLEEVRSIIFSRA